MPLLSKDTVMHITTMAPAQKIMHAPTLTFVKSVQANTVGNSAQSSNKRSTNNSLGIPAQALLSPPSQSKSKITTPINQKVLAQYLKGYDQTLSNFLIEGFKFGFKIPYQVLRQFLQICLPLKERNLF